MPVILVSRKGILRGDHDLMQLLSRTDAGLPDTASRQHRLRQIRDLKGRYLADKSLSAGSLRQSLNNKLNTLRQTDPETGHPYIRDWKLLRPLLDQLMEQRYHGTSAARHISITDDGKIDILHTGIGIGRHKQLVRHQLRAAVQIDGIDRLVRR